MGSRRPDETSDPVEPDLEKSGIIGFEGRSSVVERSASSSNDTSNTSEAHLEFTVRQKAVKAFAVRHRSIQEVIFSSGSDDGGQYKFDLWRTYQRLFTERELTLTNRAGMSSRENKAMPGGKVTVAAMRWMELTDTFLALMENAVERGRMAAEEKGAIRGDQPERVIEKAASPGNDGTKRVEAIEKHRLAGPKLHIGTGSVRIRQIPIDGREGVELPPGGGGQGEGQGDSRLQGEKRRMTYRELRQQRRRLKDVRKVWIAGPKATTPATEAPRRRSHDAVVRSGWSRARSAGQNSDARVSQSSSKHERTRFQQLTPSGTCTRIRKVATRAIFSPKERNKAPLVSLKARRLRSGRPLQRRPKLRYVHHGRMRLSLQPYDWTREAVERTTRTEKREASKREWAKGREVWEELSGGVRGEYEDRGEVERQRDALGEVDLGLVGRERRDLLKGVEALVRGGRRRR